jgi:hypothetical protein
MWENIFGALRDLRHHVPDWRDAASDLAHEIVATQGFGCRERAVLYQLLEIYPLSSIEKRNRMEEFVLRRLMRHREFVAIFLRETIHRFH